MTVGASIATVLASLGSGRSSLPLTAEAFSPPSPSNFFPPSSFRRSSVAAGPASDAVAAFVGSRPLSPASSEPRIRREYVHSSILFSTTSSSVSTTSQTKEESSSAFAEKSEIVDSQLRKEEEDDDDDEEEEPLNVYPDPPPGCPFSPSEWKQRCELAVSYRIAFMEDWAMNIFNHITLKVEGSESEPDGPHFLLNEYGMGFDEITASSLLKVTLDGTQVWDDDKGGEGEGGGAGRRRRKGRVFKPGYVIHSAVHGARHDVRAVWHCHHVDATAVCQTKTGLLNLGQEATLALAKGLSYHPFEGSANSEDERPRIVSDLGPTNKVLMLEDHGPLVAGETLEEAYGTMWFLTRACRYQVRSTASVGGDLGRIHIPEEEVRDEMERRADKFNDAPSVKVECEESGEVKEVVEKHDTEGLMFACARRAAERKFGAESIYL